MWDLNDERTYLRVVRFEMLWVKTHGADHRQKRERIREAAAPELASVPPEIKQWGFRILVRRARNKKSIDIENVPKLIVDAFSKSLIRTDGSPFSQVGLYEDDTIDHVTVLQVAGERVNDTDSTVVEIFGRRPT